MKLPWFSVRAREQLQRRAFTRFELAAIVSAVSVIVLMVLPTLASTSERNRRIVCLNNLRQVGLAFRCWGNDHGDRKPWMVRQSEGGIYQPLSTIDVPGLGTFPSGLRNNPWFQFTYVWRELGDPKVLVCPEDVRKVARSWQNTAEGGYIHPSYQNSATSYTIGLHTSPQTSRSVLSTDRNLGYNGQTSGCSYQVGVSYSIHLGLPGWEFFNTWNGSPNVHQGSGNVLFNDGGVEDLSNEGLDKALSERREDDNASLHFLIP